MSEREREIVFYDCHDSEALSHSDPDEAIEEWLDCLWPEPGNEHPADLLSKLPKTLTLRRFSRMELPKQLDALTFLLEQLDEEYGDPDGEYTVPTPAMKEAEAAFLAVVRREYVPWQCEEIGSEEVDVGEWVRAHHPEWLQA